MASKEKAIRNAVEKARHGSLGIDDATLCLKGQSICARCLRRFSASSLEVTTDDISFMKMLGTIEGPGVEPCESTEVSSRFQIPPNHTPSIGEEGNH